MPTKPEKSRKPKKKRAKGKQVENVIDESNSSDYVTHHYNNRQPMKNQDTKSRDTSPTPNHFNSYQNDTVDSHPKEFEVIQTAASNHIPHYEPNNDRKRNGGPRMRRIELPDDSPMPHLTDAQRLEARRRKKLSLRQKTLDVILNERYVSELNTNQNNRNVSGVDVSGSVGDSSMRSEEELGRHVGRIVAERLQDGCV